MLRHVRAVPSGGVPRVMGFDAWMELPLSVAARLSGVCGMILVLPCQGLSAPARAGCSVPVSCQGLGAPAHGWNYHSELQRKCGVLASLSGAYEMFLRVVYPRLGASARGGDYHSGLHKVWRSGSAFRCVRNVPSGGVPRVRGSGV